MFGISKYTYTQSAPSTTWVLNHNIGLTPIVNTLIDIGGELKPALPVSIVHNAANTVTTITWSSPRTGQATIAYAA
jgi:hypothetical protein